MLGIPYSFPLDMWSVGCVLYELYCGSILFQGRDNNDMLFWMMQVKGPFPLKMLKKASLASAHFDSEYVFERRRTDEVTGRVLKRKEKVTRPTRNIFEELRSSGGKLQDSELKDLRRLSDLIEKCLVLDPSARIKPSEALKHPFFQDAESLP